MKSLKGDCCDVHALDCLFGYGTINSNANTGEQMKLRIMKLRITKLRIMRLRIMKLRIKGSHIPEKMFSTRGMSSGNGWNEVVIVSHANDIDVSIALILVFLILYCCANSYKHNMANK